MAGFEPEHGDLLDVVERIAKQASLTFQDAETRLLAEIARRLIRDLPELPELAEQLRIVHDLEAFARQLTAGITHDLAAEFVAQASTSGIAAAMTHTGWLPSIPPVSMLTQSHVLAAALVAADLGNAFADMTARILRYPRDAMGQFIVGGDVYQQVVANHVPSVMLGSSTASARKAATREFLERGVTGFTDVAGRNWRIGTYAEMATRTAVARAYRDAYDFRVGELGLDLFTVLGGRNACHACAQWFGKVLAMTGVPGPRLVQHATADRMVTVEVAATVAQWRASGAGHPNCFPGFVPVGSPTGVLAADSRWFEGEVVVIDTAGGRKLTVTPNHPVLTERGWVAAGALVKGDDLFSYHGGQELVSSGVPDHVGREAPIGEVFESLRQSSEVTSVLVPGAAEQFHGDGGDSEVDVVLAHRLLGNDGKPLAGDELAEAEFLIGRVSEASLLAERASFEVFARALHAAHSGVSGSGLGDEILRGQGRVVDADRLADSSNVRSGLAEPLRERDAVDLGDDGELLDALAGFVSRDQVVEVHRERFEGHVYNLQTGGGWYTADSIVVHNCTCERVVYLPGLSAATSAEHYDPAAQRARDQLRALERSERDAKRKYSIAAAAGADVDAARWRREVLTIQAQTRAHVEATAQRRRYDRAQIRFADGA